MSFLCAKKDLGLSRTTLSTAWAMEKLKTYHNALEIEIPLHLFPDLHIDRYSIDSAVLNRPRLNAFQIVTAIHLVEETSHLALFRHVNAGLGLEAFIIDVFFGTVVYCRWCRRCCAPRWGRPPWGG